MPRPNVKEFYTNKKPREKVELPYGMTQIRHPCPMCKSNLFMLEGVVKCSSCNFKRKGKRNENALLPMLQS